MTTYTEALSFRQQGGCNAQVAHNLRKGAFVQPLDPVLFRRRKLGASRLPQGQVPPLISTPRGNRGNVQRVVCNVHAA